MFDGARDAHGDHGRGHGDHGRVHGDHDHVHGGHAHGDRGRVHDGRDDRDLLAAHFSHQNSHLLRGSI